MTSIDDQIAGLWHSATDAALAYRSGMDDRPMAPSYGATEAQAKFGGALNHHGELAQNVLADIIAKSEGGTLDFTSPRFFGYVIGASHPVGVAADTLVSAWGNPSAYADLTPAVTAMENQMAHWCAELLGLPQDCGHGIVTGATVANTVAIMAARNALLAREGWDVESDGLFGAPHVNIVLGEQAHSAVFAGLRYAGFGANRVIKLKTDDQARILPQSLEQALDGLNGPTLVILQAGSINSGDSDPFADLIPIAKAKEAWVHVDGAFGLWLNAAEQTRPQLRGVERADSWAVDLHKWLNAPYDAALVFTRDRAPLVAAMSAKGAYLPEQGAAPDPSDTVMELSRRARGVPSYAILKHLGKSGVEEMVSRHCRLAKYLAQSLAQEPDVTILNKVVSNQVAITLGDGESGDTHTQRVLAAIQKRGKVYPTHGHWKGRHTIRVSISGHQTSQSDIDLLIEELLGAWRDERGD